ncbi:hypothetical protein NKOR_00635 [Candidatus Nitrosopumilus koreensis AR1]|uniref:Uncharacterized protein n=1 Tax=Candidatus Nitrosopumilus koreensis AR1 TaxID=1229908 RepID=K0B559_9ARCH|nr:MULTISPECIES: hypothetical protein [Nitrosopumilus]AFS80045.1 hypothetical protein NKOR_00635 [Candidatus Nitrosopumilus koreensis AR1]
MDANQKDSAFHIDISDLEEIEKKERKRKYINEYQRKYAKRSYVKDKLSKQKQNKTLTEKIKKLGTEDPHRICKKLGRTRAYGRRHPEYFYRCSKCDVSYSDKEKEHFYKENKCPCCHLMLRQRKTVTQKKSLN